MPHIQDIADIMLSELEIQWKKIFKGKGIFFFLLSIVYAPTVLTIDKMLFSPNSFGVVDKS